MEIISAKNIGFCFGVKRAISITKQTLKEKERPVQFLGSLIHNENVVNGFLKKGVVFKKNIKEIKSGVLIIQTHGIPPFFKKLKVKVAIKDATCPLVKKVQLLAQSLTEKDYQVIIIGEKKHSEVKGIKGYAKKSIIIENEKEAEKIPFFKNKKVALISQTTQNLKKVRKIFKILKKNNPGIKNFKTVCPEVEKRQKETKQIIKKADQILIIGSKKSANTKRLYEISKKSGKPVYWINSLKELKKEKINKHASIGLMSGTSANDTEIEKIKNYLLKI